MHGLVGNGALLLTTAASLLASPAGAWAVGRPEASSGSASVPSKSDVDTYGAYVTLDIGQDRDLVLQLDLSDTDRVCSPSVPSVYRQALHSKPGSQGSGKLILGDESGPSVQARWTRECITERNEAETEPEAVEVEVAQRLEMTIESVDGVALANKVSFVAVLESPDAGKAVVSYSLRLESEDFAQRPKTYITSSTFGRQGGEAVSDMDSTPQNSFWKCRGFRCVLDSLRDRIGRLKQDFYEWRKPQQHESDVDGEMESYTASYEDGGVGSGMEDQDSLPNSEGGETEGDDSWWHILERPSAHTQQEQQRVKPIKPSEVKPEVMAATPIHTPFSIPSISPPDKTLIMTLVLAAVAFTLFSLSSICLIRMRYTPEIQRRPRQTTHRETPEERQARVVMRREAVRGFFHGMFCGIFSFSEKDGPGVEPQGRDLRVEAGTYSNMSEDNSDPTTPTTTMEQELAGFREAASLVSSLIAAEEGRRQTVQRPRPEPLSLSPPVPIPGPPRPMYPYSGYDYSAGGLASPPSYEADAAEASMVSDGFQYSPGQFNFQYSPSSSPRAGPQGISNSDRLGYGNKD